jgi:Putative Ig domain/Fibronectin type III domain
MSFGKAAAARRRYGVSCALVSLALLTSTHAHANTPPKIWGTPTASVVAAHYYTWQPSATDADGNKLTFSIVNKPAWAGFDAATGRLYGTPIPPGSVGTFGSIVIKVSDGLSTVSLPAFAVTVQPLPNIPPTISGAPATGVQVGQAYSFQPAASDANGLRVTFGIWDKPAWATFDNNTGRLYGTPTSSNVGTTTNIVITAYDGYHSASLPAFSITVGSTTAVAVSSTPTLSTGTVTLAWTPPTENTDGTTLTNLAGYHIYYGTSETNLNQRIDVANPGLASYVISNLAPATWYFAVAAYNSNGYDGGNANASFVVH